MTKWQAEIKRLFAEHNVRKPADLQWSKIPKVSHPEKAIHAINFIQTLCTHTKGQWAGVRFDLLKWQWLPTWRMFGTCRPDGNRQYRNLYCEVPKKNGKSEWGAALALKMLVADGEIGAEVYSAASDISQAALVYNVAAQMVRNSQVLSKRLKIIDSRKRIIDYQTNSFYQVLSSEAFTKHGINPSAIIFDELHAQPTRELWDTLTEGTDYARSQQLVFAITTAGIYDQNSICWEVREHARQLIEGMIEDSTTLPVIYAIDKKEDKKKPTKVFCGMSKPRLVKSHKIKADWENPQFWKLVNPSIGHIFTADKIKADLNKVKQQPARLNNFLRFRLNIWVNQIDRWIDMHAFDDCIGEIDPGKLLKRKCYGGLDLASVNDLTALSLVFPPEKPNEKWQMIVKCYVPEDSIVRRTKEHKVNYIMWRDAGYITATPGNVTDYNFILADILNADKIYNLRELAYDPYSAHQIATELDNDHGITMVEHRQGYLSMSEPSKNFEKKILSGELLADKNPVLRWCVDNLVITEDAAGNIKPVKNKAREKIDAAVAAIMALGRAVLHFDESSVYEKRGLRSL